LEEDISVTKVIVYNRNNYQDRLSDAIVSLLDENDNVIGTYQIGDVSNIASIEIDITDFTFTSTSNGLTLETQELAYGSANQQFIYVEDENKIVSLMCPDFAITIPDGDCATLEGLYLSSGSYSDNRNKWDFTYFDGNDIIQSLECQDKFITISGATGGQARNVLLSSEKISKKSDRNSLNPFTAVQSQAQKSKTQTVMTAQRSIAQVRKVKVQHDETLNQILNIGEILVYDESNSNKALNKPATQSSNISQTYGSASKAVDGNQYTSLTTASELGAWWQVDLEHDVTVSKVVVYNPQNCSLNRLTNAIISLLDDNDDVIGTYQIGDEIENKSNDYMIEISASDFQVESSSQQTESSLPESETYNATEESTAASYSNTVETQTAVWDGTTYPSSGSTIVLSDFNAERFQKWTKQHQLFHPLMGPFSIVNPHSGLALAVEDGTCANGMSLNSETDDHTSSRQMFYLGQHGSIFGAQCPGLVIAADSSSHSSAIRLEIFQHNEEKLKWKFTNGMVESVLYPGMVLAKNSNDDSMILQSTDSNSDSNMNWIRTNTRLLDLDDQSSEWKRQWTVSFISSDYQNVSIEDFVQDDDINWVSKCYDMSSAFSPSFDDFAKELVIEDASDEDQCRNVREGLGFDKDHPFDTEVRDSFYEYQCDPFFTGVDHESKNDMEALAAPPQFEMVDYTPVEYEAVEYEEADYITVDYEEFAE